MRCFVIARSWKTIRGNQWKIALWEIDYRAPDCGKDMIDWTPLKTRLP